MMALSDTIDAIDLPPYLRTGGSQPQEALALPTVSDGESPASLLENSERLLISEALAKTSRNQSEAARSLCIGRDALRYKMKKYGLADPMPG